MGSIGPRPTIYLLEQFPPAAVAHCQSLFNTVLPTDPEINNWRENATAILNLKAIGKQGVGIDIIDQGACAKRGIPILNTPGANAQSVAELVLSLTMAVARQLRTIVVNQAANIEVRKEHCSGTTLQGKTIGIIGMGNIGLAVGRIFRGAFNSPIFAYDPFASKDAWSNLDHIRVDNIDDMLPHVDVLSLHLPLTPETRHFIATPQIRKMKKSAILINAARGGIVNEEDLIAALNEGALYGVGLDCHDEEPPTLGRYSKLWATGRVISTPHIGATTSETQIHTATTALNRVYDYLTQSQTD
ncbi:D-isomer specific 2-hydroxyacid dehydrogenase [Aspergillus keveii]|uniref:D-isomer specific 2-hydroxyacid dehydrogenase n=1 Tax=Aspergillus keveii TaxID=714993 RepID=A0ABR4G0N7_9EURO